MKQYSTLIEALRDLRLRGYKADFTTQTVCLYCGDLDMRLDPQDFYIDETYRFEEDLHGNSYLLLAITSSSGVKGIVLDNYCEGTCSIQFEMTRELRGYLQQF